VLPAAGMDVSAQVPLPIPPTPTTTAPTVGGTTTVLPGVPVDAPACANDAGSLCARVFADTHASWLSRSADAIVSHAVAVAVIVVAAVLLRYVLHRGIRRLTDGARTGRVPQLLRPLRDRAAASLREAAPQIVERRTQRAQTIGSVLRSFTTLLVFGVAFVMILGEFGMNLAPILASAGVVGVAIGFGAQNLVRDFLSGIFMMLEDQYGVGDTVDLGPASGTVESIGLRVTTIRDAEGTLWYVRNGEISRVGNHSQHFSIALIDVPVGHGTNIAHATAIAETAAREAVTEAPLAEMVLDEVTVLGVQSVTAEAMTLRLTVTTKPGQQVAVRRAMFGAVSTAFTEAQIPPPVTTPATAAVPTPS
jgi:moderate conductance mechanosensitive channel